MLWLVAWAGNTTVVGAIFDASQYSGFFVSVYWVGAKRLSMKGPVPTGWVLVNVTGLAIDDQTCSGTIGVCAIVAGERDVGRLERERDVVARGGDAALICDQTPLVSSAGYFFSRLNVNTTSAGVNGGAVAPLHARSGSCTPASSGW